jgi:hypothetical protein
MFARSGAAGVFFSGDSEMFRGFVQALTTIGRLLRDVRSAMAEAQQHMVP